MDVSTVWLVFLVGHIYRQPEFATLTCVALPNIHRDQSRSYLVESMCDEEAWNMMVGYAQQRGWPQKPTVSLLAV